VRGRFATYKLKQFEVSAKEGTGIQAMFESVIGELDNRRKEVGKRSEEKDIGGEQEIGTAQQIIKNFDHNSIPLKNPTPPSPQTYRNCCQP
jgi:hypothetical protein